MAMRDFPTFRDGLPYVPGHRAREGASWPAHLWDAGQQVAGKWRPERSPVGSDQLIGRLGAAGGVLFAVCIFFGNGNLLGDSSSTDTARSLYGVLSNTQSISLGVLFTTVGALFAVGFAAAL